MRNPNPKKKIVGDCVVRAISTATGQSWYRVYDEICQTGRERADMPNADASWGLYLYRIGYEPFLLPGRFLTVRDFAAQNPEGTFIIGTGDHAVAVMDGDYFDTFDSGDLSPSFFWAKERR